MRFDKSWGEFSATIYTHAQCTPHLLWDHRRVGTRGFCGSNQIRQQWSVQTPMDTSCSLDCIQLIPNFFALELFPIVVHIWHSGFDCDLYWSVTSQISIVQIPALTCWSYFSELVVSYLGRVQCSFPPMLFNTDIQNICKKIPGLPHFTNMKYVSTRGMIVTVCLGSRNKSTCVNFSLLKNALEQKKLLW